MFAYSVVCAEDRWIGTGFKGGMFLLPLYDKSNSVLRIEYLMKASKLKTQRDISKPGFFKFQFFRICATFCYQSAV